MSVNINMMNCKTISQMSQAERDEYPVEKNWRQDRELFNSNNHENCSSYYYGGNSYQEVLDSRLSCKTRLFETTMKNLTEKDLYLDIGAGNGKALLQYRKLFPNGAKVAGIASTQPQGENLREIIEQDQKEDKFSFYLCDFKEFSTDELSGRVTVITDVLGALRYGRDPACVVQKIGALLKEGGLVFFKFAYSDHVQVPEGFKNRGYEDNLRSLFYWWFHTIRGFDVLQGDMTLEESKQFQTTLTKLNQIVSKRFSEYAIVLRRNHDPVEVDRLIIDSKADENPEFTKNRNWDSWYPNYTWEISEYSKTLLHAQLKIEQINETT